MEPAITAPVRSRNVFFFTGLSVYLTTSVREMLIVE